MQNMPENTRLKNPSSFGEDKLDKILASKDILSFVMKGDYDVNRGNVESDVGNIGGNDGGDNVDGRNGEVEVGNVFGGNDGDDDVNGGNGEGDVGNIGGIDGDDNVDGRNGEVEVVDEFVTTAKNGITGNVLGSLRN